MKTVRLTSSVPLNATELSNLKSALKLTAADHISQVTDASLIAGLIIEVDGAVVDLSVKRQLAEIAGDN